VRPQSIPPLPDGEVHVWLDQVPDDASAQADWAGLLTATELETARRLRVPARRASFVRGRWLLRTLVAGYAGVPAPSVTLEKLGKGKPFVTGPRAALGLEVSISRSGGLLAVSLGRRVGGIGVDVEQEIATRDLVGVAERFFAAEEFVQLAAQPPGAWAAAFYRCWTRKEAVIKATGEGLSLPLGDFAVSLDERPRVLRMPDAWGGRWTLLDLAPGDGYAGAIAVRGEAVLRRFLWTGA
jgi:4'-phosphopantetheinyl transferase